MYASDTVYYLHRTIYPLDGKPLTVIRPGYFVRKEEAQEAARELNTVDETDPWQVDSLLNED